MGIVVRSWELLLAFGIVFRVLGSLEVSFCRSFESIWSLMLHKDHCRSRDLRFDICHWVLLDLEHSGPTVGLVQASRWAGIRLLRFAFRETAQYLPKTAVM